MNPSAPPAYDEKPTTGIPVPGQFQANHPGQFQANHPGQFQANHPGQFQANHPGQFQANHPGQFQANHPGTWSTGLCDCSSDCSSCCLTCWCPCITFGRIAEIVDKGTFPCVASGALYFLIGALTGCGCFYSCFYRKKMRKQYVLPESPCGDCLLHFCCEGCALCQEYRELKHRGYDMSIGWQENMDKHNRGIQMAPGVQGGMTR